MEVQEVGIQVGPEDFCSWCKNWRSECNHSAMRRGEENSAQRQNYQYQRAPLDEEDDGYNGSSNNTDDDRDEDVKTIHISATSTRLERRKASNTGNSIYIYIIFFKILQFYTFLVVLSMLIFLLRFHLGNKQTSKTKKVQSTRYRQLLASSSDRTGGESSDPTDGIINFVTDSEDERAFSSPSPAPTQSDAGFQVDIPRGVANSKFNASNKHIIHAQIEERNERKGKRD